MQQIRKSTAQQIVETVKDVSGYDINFINQRGIIFASTDPARVGDFHEIGFQVIQTGAAIEVEEDDSFLGTHRGINMPFFFRGELAAVIGISGKPDEVRKYVYLAQRITNLILREHEMDERRESERARLNYIIRALILGETVNFDFLAETLKEYHIKPDTPCRTVVVRLAAGETPSNVSAIERSVYQAFDQTRAELYTFHYPSEYILLIEQERYQKWAYVFRRLAEEWEDALQIGIGSVDLLSRQDRSYEAARIALASLAGGQKIAVFDELDLEILLGAVPESARRRYLEKTASALTDGDRQVLEAYFGGNLSLKAAGEALYLHKNTVQYRLDRIAEKTGHNPRVFSEAVLLYLATKLE